MAATTALVVHLVWPHLKSDTLTVVLVITALIPWFAPLVTRIKLPGGYEVEFRELQGEIKQLAQQVDEVQRWIFENTSSETQQSLSLDLERYDGYLKALPLARNESLRLPVIRNDPYGPNQSLFYLAENRIVLSGIFAEDPDMALHEYTHQVLYGAVPELTEELQLEIRPVEAGLAAYFPCSFRDDAVLGRRTIEIATAQGIDDAGFNLETSWRVDMSDSTSTKQILGRAWGAGFWDLRGVIGQEQADLVLARAWTDPGITRPGHAIENFVQAALRQLEQEPSLADHAPQIAELWGERAFPLLGAE